MSIYNKYNDDEIQNIRTYVKGLEGKFGVSAILGLFMKAQNRKAMWKEYLTCIEDQDLKEELESNQNSRYVPNKFLDRIVEVYYEEIMETLSKRDDEYDEFQNDDSDEDLDFEEDEDFEVDVDEDVDDFEKDDEDEYEDKYDDEYDNENDDEYEEFNIDPQSEKELKKLQIREAMKINQQLEIVSDDDEIRQMLINGIDEIEYDAKDIISRAKFITTILFSLRMMYVDDNYESLSVDYDEWKDLKKIIAEKIEKLDYIDFSIIYQSIGGYSFFDDYNFEQSFLNKINKMNKNEFAHFLITIEGKFSEDSMDIVNRIIEKTKECNSKFLYTVYNDIFTPGIMPPLNNEKHGAHTLDLVDKLRRNALMKNSRDENGDMLEYDMIKKKVEASEELKEYLEELNGLYQKEFFKYLFVYECDSERYGEEEKVLKSKLAELSDDDVKCLLIRHNVSVIKDENGYNFLRLEAIKRGFLTEQGEMNLADEEVDKILEKNKEYYSSFEETYMPYCDVFFNTFSEQAVEEYEEEFLDIEDEDEIEYLEEQRELKRISESYKQVREKTERNISVLSVLNTLESMDDVRIMLEINKTNASVSQKEYRSLKKEKKVSILKIINYLKARILAMDTRFAYFYSISENGCLNDVIEMKYDEMKEVLQKRKSKVDKSHE